jgi:hypothetical protein
LFPCYSLALDQNLAALISEIKNHTYQPAAPTIVFKPKKTGVLRPLTLLSFRDLIVYQAVVNVVGAKLSAEQQKFAGNRAFGNILAGQKSPYLYRPWKTSYGQYSQHLKRAYEDGNVYVAEFDLVSFYELIDHNLLRYCLANEVHNRDIVKLLFLCLGSWTTNASSRQLRHGIPQGPEPSAFLAECMLFEFDAIKFKDVKYLRYVDDIRLMSKSEPPLRRALLKLDLASKNLGLVPQAQKIGWRRVDSLDDLLKSIPSSVATAEAGPKGARQKDLRKTFRMSVTKVRGSWDITDVTKFKYSLLRLNPGRDILKRIRPMLAERPDLSWVFSMYLKKFPEDREAADILLESLKRDPTYDSAAAAYIEAMDVCEPPTNNTGYRRAIQTANRRSEEKTISLRIASLAFRGRRAGPKEAVRLIDSDTDPLVKCIVLHRLFGDEQEAPFKVRDCTQLLDTEVCSANDDLALYAGYVRLHASVAEGNPWSAPTGANDVVKRMLVGLGLRSRSPRPRGLLDNFFARHSVKVTFSWKKALGSDWADAEHRCLRLQKLIVDDPTATILMLDTFNEVLIQNFSIADPSLSKAYRKAAGVDPHPDFGNWLNNASLAKALPKAVPRFLGVHQARVRGDLAHAKAKRGKGRGKPTREISFTEANALLKDARVAWQELVTKWSKHI